MVVSGSLPMYLRTARCGEYNIAGPQSGDFGDSEQKHQGSLLYENLSYLDLYVMASAGLNRRHIQYFVEHDPQVFNGTNYLHYEHYITEVVEQLGGTYYATHNHWSEVHGYPRQDGDYPNWEDMLLFPLLEEREGSPRLELQIKDSLISSDGWKNDSTQGFGGDSLQATPESRTSVTWIFDVTPGTYFVAVTWPITTNPTEVASYVIKSNSDVLASFSVNQQLQPPDSGWWKYEQALTVPTDASDISVILESSDEGNTTADAVMIWAATELIFDDDSHDFETSFCGEDDWLNIPEQGFNDWHLVSRANCNTSSARWLLELKPGRYSFYATWVHDKDRTTNAVYSIREADNESVISKNNVNQRFEPNDIETEKGRWELIAPNVVLRGGRVQVTLDNSDIGGTLAADAIRVVRLGNQN